MAQDDRDYMRDRIRQRDSYTEKSPFRRSLSGEQDYRYNPKQFRSTRTDGSGSGSTWSNLWRFVFICLAVYGALSAVRDLHRWAGQL